MQKDAIRVPFAPALGLRLPTGRPDPEVARPARPPRQPSGAYPFLRFCAKLSRATTQIKIDGDAYLHDDFAFATRNGLIPEVRRSTDPAAINARGLNAPFAEITFDFVLHPESAAAPNTVVTRPHAEAA
jgi:catechol 1,2-dioxygenase